MHRAFGRAIRGTCRKWRENECPVAAGEEVRRNKEEDGKKDFTPPKHTLEEAVTWTAGLVLGYQLTHQRRRNQVLFGENPVKSTESCRINKIAKAVDVSKKPSSCPFAVSSKVLTQPIFNLGTGLNVKSRNSTTVIQSIDVAPFIQDHTQESDFNSKNQSCSLISDDEDDDGIVFEEELSSEVTDVVQPNTKFNLSSVPSPSSSSSAIDSAVEYGRRFGGDLLSVLGAFEFLKAEAEATTKASTTSKTGKKAKKKNKHGVFGNNPPLHALELMQKGTDLGSSRALYNIGVAYDRMKEIKVAKEYYQKAADLGHPLATYNCAVLALKDGRLTEGYALMKKASDFEVPEAKTFLNPRDEAVTPQLQNMQVGNA